MVMTVEEKKASRKVADKKYREKNRVSRLNYNKNYNFYGLKNKPIIVFAMVFI